jgi:hypothetical protein
MRVEQAYAATTEQAAKELERDARELMAANQNKQRALEMREQALEDALAMLGREKQEAAAVLEQKGSLAVKEEWLTQQRQEMLRRQDEVAREREQVHAEAARYHSMQERSWATKEGAIHQQLLAQSDALTATKPPRQPLRDAMQSLMKLRDESAVGAAAVTVSRSAVPEVVLTHCLPADWLIGSSCSARDPTRSLEASVSTLESMRSL